MLVTIFGFLFVLIKIHSRSFIIQPLDISLYIVSFVDVHHYLISLSVYVCQIIWLVVCICIVCVYSMGFHYSILQLYWGLCSAVIHWILEIDPHIYYISEHCINSWNPFLPVSLVLWCFCNLKEERTKHPVVVLP